MTGIGHYVRSILAPLDAALPDAQFVLYARARCDVELPSERWSIRCDEHPVWSRLPTVVWIHYRLGSLVRGDGLDVFWAANTLLPARMGSLPCVTTVYDLNHVLFPQTMSLLTKVAHQRWFESDVLRATRVVAISKGTSTRLKVHLGKEADAIARPGVPDHGAPPLQSEASLCLDRLGVRRPFFLTVGTLEPRKNLASVISAVQLLKANGRVLDHQLVMVGARGWGPKFQVAAPKPISMEWVKPLGYVNDAALAALYLSADALVFPSRYEGYGIPIGEARAYGCRVVATDIPELRESGGEDVVYVEPTPKAIAQGVVKALSNPAPPPRNAVYDWHSAAQTIGAMLRDVSLKRR